MAFCRENSTFLQNNYAKMPTIVTDYVMMLRSIGNRATSCIC